jgi:hypothetical protein
MGRRGLVSLRQVADWFEHYDKDFSSLTFCGISELADKIAGFTDEFCSVL